jgi:hypothetical protein
MEALKFGSDIKYQTGGKGLETADITSCWDMRGLHGNSDIVEENIYNWPDGSLTPNCECQRSSEQEIPVRQDATN